MEQNLKEKTEDDVRASVKARPIFIIQNASLSRALVRKRWKILDAEEDADYLVKRDKKLADFRPRKLYQALRAIFDSKLNKAGMVGAVYVKTDKGILFEVKPHVRIPRTYKRFCGVILELLEKQYIQTKETNETLMCVIKEPISQLIPANSRVVELSHSTEHLVDINDYVNSVSDSLNLVFVVGAMVHQKTNKEYVEDVLSVSNYRLTAKSCIGLICESLEYKWKIF